LPLGQSEMQLDQSSISFSGIDLPDGPPAGLSFRSELRQIMEIGRICAWLVGIGLLAACSTTPPPDCAAQKDITEYRQRLSQTAGQVAYGQGLLWRVDRADVPPSYVFGTAHCKDPRITRLAEPVAAAFETASSLTIEIVHTPEVDRAVERAVKIPDGNVERLVGQERFRQIKAAGARYGSDLEALRRFKPWALYLLFTRPPAEIRNNPPELDFVLQQRAGEQGIPVSAWRASKSSLPSSTILTQTVRSRCSTRPLQRTGV
jgi:TraB/PrgY/gumN family